MKWMEAAAAEIASETMSAFDSSLTEETITEIIKKHHTTTGRVCKFPGCVAAANVDRDHCTIHYPENVVVRAVEIVTKLFWPVTNRKMMYVEAGNATVGVQRILSRVRDRIINEIKRTT